MTFLSRDVQWRRAVPLRRILVRASCNERGHHGLVTFLSRDVECEPDLRPLGKIGGLF